MTQKQDAAVFRRCPTLAELPTPLTENAGWPWTEETPPLPDFRPNGSPWPPISIVIPTYNQVDYIEETLRAILLQGYPQLQLIVIDGGSTDGALEIIKRYAKYLSFWVSEPDDGQSDAINKGFARCEGEILTYCNSDDFYSPGTFADVAHQAVKHPDYGAVIGAFYYIDAHSNVLSTLRPPHLNVEAPVDLTREKPGTYRLHQSATFFLRAALDEVGRYVNTDLHYVMDRELLYRLLRRYKIVLRDQAYVAFRTHAASKSIADILPFAAEFAALYRSLNDGGEPARRKREGMARYHYARGYLKLAQAAPNWWSRMRALVYVLRYKPDYLLKKGYYARWLKLFA